MLVTAEQREEAVRRDLDQRRVFVLEYLADKATNPFVQKRYRDKIQKIMQKWNRVPA